MRGSSSDTSKAAQPNRIDTRPAFDRYIPEKSVEQKSYGHYKLVSDERGNQKIQFSEPAENPTGNSEGISAPVCFLIVQPFGDLIRIVSVALTPAFSSLIFGFLIHL